MFIRYSLAVCAGGLFTGLAYYHQSKKRPFLISAQPLPAKKINDISEVFSKTTKSYISKTYPSLCPVIKYGIPSYDGLQVHEKSISSYNSQSKVPRWVMEYLTNDMLEGEAQRKNTYITDTSIHQFFISTKDDYKSSGFDKGHLARAQNYKSSQKAMDETFSMSNMAPQDPKFNRYELWRALEDHVIKLVGKKYGKYEGVYVCSGTLYLPQGLCGEQEATLLTLLEENENGKLTGEQEANVPSKHKQKSKKRQSRNEQEEKLVPNNKENVKKRGEHNDAKQKNYYIIYKVIGDNLVAVPTHYFKVLLCKVKENLYDIEAYMIPNKSYDPKTSKTPEDRTVKEVTPNKPNDPKNSKAPEDRTLKEVTPNKPNDPKNSKTPEDRTLKEVTPNKPNDPKISKAKVDSRLKDFLIPKEAIEKSAGFLIYPELQQSQIRRNKSKESAAGSEYYNI